MRPVSPASLLVLVIALAPSSSAAGERPLPDRDTFLREVRLRLETDEARQGEYMYRETRRETRLDASGKATRNTVRVYESYPALPGEQRWSRLVSEDGTPVPQAEFDTQDRERQEHVREWLRKHQGSEKGRAAAARERETERRKDAARLDDAFAVYDIRMLGREVIDGHETVGFSLTPRRDAKPRTREGRILKHFAAKAWISESEYELVRLEAEALDTVSFGLGLFARVHKGSRATFERRKVNGEAWLPARAEYFASARVMLLRRLRVGGSSEFSGYHKFTVTTETTVAGGQ
jgi:hypothetical protein